MGLLALALYQMIKPQRMEQIYKAVVEGSRAGLIVSFNGLTVAHEEDKAFYRCVTRSNLTVTSVRLFSSFFEISIL